MMISAEYSNNYATIINRNCFDCFQTKKEGYEASNKLRNIKVKKEDFVAFTQQFVFSNTHKICSGQDVL